MIVYTTYIKNGKTTKLKMQRQHNENYLLQACRA